MSYGVCQYVSYEYLVVCKVCFIIIEWMLWELGCYLLVIVWQFDNEMKVYVSEDYSDVVIVNWYKWLKKWFKYIDVLNKVWGMYIWSQYYMVFE